MGVTSARTYHRYSKLPGHWLAQCITFLVDSIIQILAVNILHGGVTTLNVKVQSNLKIWVHRLYLGIYTVCVCYIYTYMYVYAWVETCIDEYIYVELLANQYLSKRTLTRQFSMFSVCWGWCGCTCMWGVYTGMWRSETGLQYPLNHSLYYL